SHGRAAVKPPRHCLRRHNVDERSAMSAPKSAGAKLSCLGLLARSGRTSKLPSSPSMSMQCHFSAGWATGNAALWALSWSHLVRRRVLFNPALDVQLTSYISSGASCFLQWSTRSRPGACDCTLQVTFSPQGIATKSVVAPAPGRLLYLSHRETAESA